MFLRALGKLSVSPYRKFISLNKLMTPSLLDDYRNLEVGDILESRVGHADYNTATFDVELTVRSKSVDGKTVTYLYTIELTKYPPFITKSMKDPLGERMKSQYEDRTRYFVPRRTFTIIRLDSKAFHTYTRGLKKPFDHELSEDIDSAIIDMLPEIQGAVFAYTQSDEISVLVTDFSLPTTSAWFDGNIQKMASVSASILTARFNQYRLSRFVQRHSLDVLRNDAPIAFFDSRVFTIPDRIEVMNYFRWRQQDCVRNSVSMVAQANFSHKELHGKSTPE